MIVVRQHREHCQEVIVAGKYIEQRLVWIGQLIYHVVFFEVD